jgi:hypothetical protein
MTASSVIQKLWNCCNVLRDDDLPYGNCVEQFELIAEERRK